MSPRVWSDADDEIHVHPSSGRLWRWQTTTVGPEAVGFTERQYRALRTLEEGRLDAELEHYYAAELAELERAELVASDTAPEIRSRPVGDDDDSAVETYSVDVRKYYVTPRGRIGLAKVGTFRRREWLDIERRTLELSNAAAALLAVAFFAIVAAGVVATWALAR